jgi:hypothetical protein
MPPACRSLLTYVGALVGSQEARHKKDGMALTIPSLLNLAELIQP